MVSVKTQESGDLLQFMMELEKPEVQKSLSLLMNKLPEIEKSIDSIGNIVQFGKSIIEDRAALDKYDQLASTYNLNMETITSLVVLLEKLPKLVKMIEQIENIVDFATAVIQDEQSTEYLINDLKEYAAPILNKGKDGLSLIQEIQNKVECNPHNVKLFSLVKWLKDPMVQKGLCYLEATLEVLNEKEKNRKRGF